MLIEILLEGAWSPSASDRLAYYTSTDADTLDGGAGKDAISASHGDLVTTGTGADRVRLFLDAGAGLDPTTITDFNPDEDRLMIVYDSFDAMNSAAPARTGQVTLTETDGNTIVTGAGGHPPDRRRATDRSGRQPHPRRERRYDLQPVRRGQLLGPFACILHQMAGKPLTGQVFSARHRGTGSAD